MDAQVLTKLKEMYGTDDMSKIIGSFIQDNEWLKEWLKDPVYDEYMKGHGDNFVYKGVPHRYQRFRYEGPVSSIKEILEFNLLSYMVFGERSEVTPMSGFIERKCRLPREDDEITIVLKRMTSSLIPPMNMVGRHPSPHQMPDQYARHILLDMNFITDGMVTLGYNESDITRTERFL